MNDFFKPQATAVPTITNFETGEVYSAHDIFRNLFSPNVTSTMLFGGGEEWEMENQIKESIRTIFFDTYCYIGTTTKDAPTEEQINRHKMEANEIAHFLLYNKEASPLHEFKKTFRRMFETKEFVDFGLVQERKALNLEKLEEFLGIEIPSEVAEYSDSFFVSGESGDWYMSKFGDDVNNSSFCFEDTQIKMLVRFIRRVLNVQAEATERASMRFSEGFTADSVSEELTKSFGVERIVNNAMSLCDRTAKTAVCFESYGNWVVEFKESLRHEGKEEVVEFSNQQDARVYARAKNVSSAADFKRRKNLERIEALNQELEECLAMTDKLDTEADDATALLLKAQKLARTLQVS